jgi:FixJ family two-component response regulator
LTLTDILPLLPQKLEYLELLLDEGAGEGIGALVGVHQHIELAQKESFELALIDLKMPGISGEEVIRGLKLLQPSLEIVVLTGHGSIDAAVRCTRAGSYCFLQKPCETDELLEALREAFQTRMQRKLGLSKKKIEALIDLSGCESTVEVIQRLKRLDSGEGSG